MDRSTAATRAFSAAIARQARGREVVPVRDPETGAIAFVRAVDLEDARAAAARTAAAGTIGTVDAGAGADLREPAETPAQKMDRLLRRAAGPWDGRLGDDLVLVDS